MYGLYGLIISIAGFFIVVAEKWIYNYIGITVSSKLRLKSFDKILKMPLSYFDKKENGSGNISTIIDMDCKNINKFISTILMAIGWLFSSIVFGVALSFVYDWRTALVSLGFLPLIGLSGLIQLSFAAGLKTEV